MLARDATAARVSFGGGGGGGGVWGTRPPWKLAAPPPLENCHEPYMQYKKFEWRKCPNRHLFLLLFIFSFALRAGA